MKKLLFFLFAIACAVGGYFYGKSMKTQIEVEQPAFFKENTLEKTPTVDKPGLDVRLMATELETIRLFEEAAPSTVFINTSQFRKNYFSMDVTEVPKGSGTGIVWDKKGHIITNYHVVEGADKVTVSLSDGTKVEGKVIGKAPIKDLAVVKINIAASNLRPVPIGSSKSLKVGQFVFAIGNPFGLDQTMTTGIVSALGREIKSPSGIPIKDVVQTDAAINPGNSGGPLLNSSGELVGVNTAIYSPSGASAGIGFSIPVDVVKWAIPDLIKYGELQRPVIGFEPLPGHFIASRGLSGVAVKSIVPNSPADKVGLKGIYQNKSGEWMLGDIITHVNDKEITNFDDLILNMLDFKPGQTVTITFKRKEQEKTTQIMLAKAKDVYR